MKLTTALATLLMMSPAYADEIWVTNEKDDTISVIDIETLEVTRTIQTGERPRGITFSKD
jgi:YVTN family beta-propeller protein